MNLQEYIKLATRTDSKSYEIIANPQLIVNVLALYNAAGRMLDQIKKHVFYGREYKIDLFNGDYQLMVTTLTHMAHKSIRINGTPEEMAEETITEINPRIFHAIIGIATESTELCEALYDILTSRKEIDLVNLREENGDLNWYQAIFYDAMRELGYEGTWDEDLEKNIAKLKARYPEKFTKKNAIIRDLDKERKILEKPLNYGK